MRWVSLATCLHSEGVPGERGNFRQSLYQGLDSNEGGNLGVMSEDNAYVALPIQGRIQAALSAGYGRRWTFPLCSGVDAAATGR
jgi:hypothetical protein